MRRDMTVGRRRFTFLDAGRGEPLVLIHGFPLAAEMWQPQLDAVPDGWRFIAPDLRGFGAAAVFDDTPARTIDEHAADIIDLVDALHLDRVVVCGLSMGGYAALALLRLAPTHLRGLVLADTRPQADTVEGRQGRLEMQALVERAGPGDVADRMLPKLLSATTRADRPEVALRVRAMIEANGAGAISAALDALMTRPDSTPLLPAIRVPTLIIVGEDDELTPPALSEEMHGLIPGSQLVRIEGAGHMSNLERPDAFNTALRSFLESIKS